MENEIFKGRERAEEAVYFHRQDEILIDKLRRYANLDEVARALADKLEIDDPALLDRARETGVTIETAPALLLAPLVQVAWADGSVTKLERQAVLRLATDRGVEPDSPAYAQLVEWLSVRPEDSTFDTAVQILKAGFSVLPDDEREARVKRVVMACDEVAHASGGGLARLFGLADGVSAVEASMLDTLTRTLRSRD